MIQDPKRTETASLSIDALRGHLMLCCRLSTVDCRLVLRQLLGEEGGGVFAGLAAEAVGERDGLAECFVERDALDAVEREEDGGRRERGSDFARELPQP